MYTVAKTHLYPQWHPCCLCQVVGVSAVLGTGLDELFVQVTSAAEEYER